MRRLGGVSIPEEKLVARIDSGAITSSIDSNLAKKRNPTQKIERPFMFEDKPIMIIKDAVEAQKKETWHTIYNAGFDSYQENNIDRAIELLELALTFLPNNPNTYAPLGNFYLQKKKLEKAGYYLEKGQELDPNNPSILATLGNYYYQTNQFVNAERTLIKALNVSKDAGNILRDLINVEVALGKNEAAIEYSLQALRDFPKDSNIYYNVAILYNNIASNKLEESKVIYNKIIKAEDKLRDPKVIEKILNDFKESKRIYLDARDYFLEASDLNPDDTESIEMAQKIKFFVKQLDEIFIPSAREMLNK